MDSTSGTAGEQGTREVLWPAGAAALAEVAARIGGGPLAVDTEADSFHHYRDKVCLIQLSFGATDVLVDPLSGLDLSPLAGPFGDPSVPTLLHGADYDLRLFDRDCGLRVRGLFDTMVAARLVGETAFGLSALLESYVGVRLDKKFQRADWSVRPLPPEMQRYAVHDTRFLPALAERLQARLRELGRTEWAEEEFRRLERVRWEGDRREREAWQRIKGVRKLPRACLAVLRELATLRERTACRRDVPPFRVMRDEVLVELARLAPAESSALERVRGLPRSWKSGARAAALLAAVERGCGVDPADGPRLPRAAGRQPLTREQEARLRRLREARDGVAGKLGLEPSVVAPRALLERLVRAQDEGLPVDEVADLRRWQRRLLEEALDADPPDRGV